MSGLGSIPTYGTYISVAMLLADISDQGLNQSTAINAFTTAIGAIPGFGQFTAVAATISHASLVSAEYHLANQVITTIKRKYYDKYIFI